MFAPSHAGAIEQTAEGQKAVSTQVYEVIYKLEEGFNK